jgi:hypothetical protein
MHRINGWFFYFSILGIIAGFGIFGCQSKKAELPSFLIGKLVCTRTILTPNRLAKNTKLPQIPIFDVMQKGDNYTVPKLVDSCFLSKTALQLGAKAVIEEQTRTLLGSERDKSIVRTNCNLITN